MKTRNNNSQTQVQRYNPPTRALLLLTLLMLLLLQSAAAQGTGSSNLIRNGDFEAYNELFQLQDWELSGNGVEPALWEGSGVGEVVVLFGDTNNDPSAPPQLAGTQVFLPPLPPEPNIRLILQVRIARTGLPGQLCAVLSFPDPLVNDLILPIELPTIPDNGAFHNAAASVQLPPMPLPPEALSFQLMKTGPGQIWVDDVDLRIEPQTFQIQPNSGPANSPVQIFTPFPGFETQAAFNGVPAPVIGQGPGQLTVLAPPLPPGPATVTLSAFGQTMTLTAGFLYVEPLQVESIQPPVVQPNLGAELRLRGRGFGSRMFLIVEGTQLSIQSLSPDNALVNLPPLPAGEYVLQLITPSGEIVSINQPLLVEAPPQVLAVSPPNGPATGGTEVAVNGTGFTPQSTVRFGSEPAPQVSFVSDNLLMALTPPNFPLTLDVHVINPSGIEGTLPGGFTFEQPIPGDVNNDQIVDLRDVILSLQVSAAQAPLVELDIRADANQDQRIGVEEALIAFEASELSRPFDFDQVALPQLDLLTPTVVEGTPVVVSVSNMDHAAPGRIAWGDGFYDAVNSGDTHAHTYDSPGAYDITLITEAGRTEPVTVLVEPIQTLRVLELSLSMSGINRDGTPITGRLAQIAPDAPPTVALTVVAEGSGVFEGSVRLEAAATDDTVIIPVNLTFEGEVLQAQSVILPLPQLTVPGEYFVTVPGGGGIQPGVGHSAPLTIQLPAFVTEEDCREVEEAWKKKVAEKAAKKKDCCELEKKIEDLEKQKADLEAEKKAKQDKRDGLEQEKAGKQQEYNDLFDYINDFLGSAGDLIAYSDSGDFPDGSQHVGARRAGASSGVGIAFGSAQSLLNRFDLYKQANGHSIGKDLNTLRQLIADMDGLNEQIDGLNEDIDDLNDQIDDVCDQIDALKQQLEDCKQECAGLETEIDDLVETHKECLEQLERQRKAQDAIDDASGSGGDAQEEADGNGGAADDADDYIDGRAGSPGQAQEDHDDVEEGRDCTDAAQDMIDRGRQKEQEARDALANGDTETAEQKAAEARELFEQADEKLDEAREHINGGRSSAAERKPRQCEDGTVITGHTARWKVWNEILDISLAPMGRTPEQWTSSLENGQAAINGLKNFLKVVDAAGSLSPIGGTFTPEADEAAQGIFDAHIELFRQRFPFDVYLHVRGHSHWSRVDRICINGCWENRTYGGVDEEVCEETIKIGTIWGGNRDSREEQLKKILERFANSSRFQK